MIKFLIYYLGHGNEGFGILLGLKSTFPILLCGLSIFLPHPNFIRKYNSITVFKEGWIDNLRIKVKIHEHGTSQSGPVGELVFTLNILFISNYDHVALILILMLFYTFWYCRPLH